MANKKSKSEKADLSAYISKASLSNARISPQKARLVVDMIRGKDVSSAVRELTFSDKKAGLLVKKLILSAVANAKETSSVDIDELFVKGAWVDGDTYLKRFMPRAQGRATPIQKKYSTITVVLDER